MRLPFSSSRSRGQEQSNASSRRSSLDENSEDQYVRGDTDPNNSEISGQSNSVPVNTPATSYSSYSSYTAKDGKKSGVYELSVVDNSGTFLPPSPPDTTKSSGSRAWSFHRKNNRSRERVSSFDSPFIISRESFEGYRRSFDMGHGGISPTLVATSSFANTPRLSLDSSLNTRTPSMSSRPESRLRVSSIPKVDESTTDDTPFEDVKLEDDDKNSRRTILSRFGFRSGNAQRRHRDGEELQSLQWD